MDQPGDRPAGNGLAKTSLWLGVTAVVTAVFLVGGPVGLAAVIVGIVAVRRPGNRRGAATAGIVTGAVAICLSIATLVAVLSLALTKARAQATATVSLVHLHQLSQGISLYTAEYRGQLPRSLGYLQPYMPDDGAALLDARLDTPTRSSLQPIPWPADQPPPSDFWYAGAGLRISRLVDASTHVLIYDHPLPGRPRLLAFADGHVESVPQSRVAEVVRTANANREAAGLPPLPSELDGPPPTP